MAGNSFGEIFKVTTFGESHGAAMGLVIDGCPPGLALDTELIQLELDKRRPGKTEFASNRKETDRVHILSGVFEGKTTGTPIAMMVENKDARPGDYDKLKNIFRPGHADITYFKKYGVRDHRGGGRSSARETLSRVAAGAVAQTLLDQNGIAVTAYTLELAGVRAQTMDLDQIEKNDLRTPDAKAAAAMSQALAHIAADGDSAGGIVEILATGCPPGLGEPVFDKLDADLAKALMSIGAVKAVEIGAGIDAAGKRGSANNDPITPEGFKTNHAGGILGGISNGDDIIVRAAVKPIPSIAVEQETIDADFKPTTISIKGRHDVSAIPRIVPVCQAMVRLVLADHLLRQKTVRS